MQLYTLILCCLMLGYNSIGQALTPYFNYTVTKDDQSLWSISQKHNVTVESILTLNQKEEQTVQAGEVLKIPRQTAKDDDYIIHTVTKADKNLWRIGQKYKVSVADIVKLNHKKNSIIRRGEQLKIPKNGQYIIHTVSETDKSLWGICQIYDVSVEEVLIANQKKNDLIRVGDRLIIPKVYELPIAITTSSPPVPSINGTEEGTKATFDFEKNKWRFPYHNRKELHIFPSIKTGFTNYYQLNPVEYAAFFQDAADYSPNKELKDRYFYSIEKPFAKVIEKDKTRYVTLKEKDFLGDKDGYTYDFITLIEVDQAMQSFKILPIFLVRDGFGKYAGTAEKGAFACCAEPFALASYQKEGLTETISYSKLLTSSIIQHTEIVRIQQKQRFVTTDSTILILQLKTDAVPHLIDSAEYKNGKKIRSFSNHKRRQELDY